MWTSILKRLPDANNLEGFLLSDEGVSHIQQEAEKDKKGIKAVINATKELSTGKGIKEGWNDEQRKTIISNAKKVYEILSTMLREMKSNVQPAKMQGTIAEKLDSILEANDLDAFKELLGEGRLDDSKNEKEKIKSIKDREDDVRQLIQGHEDDFYWMNTSKRTLRTVSPPPEYVEGNTTKEEHDTLGEIYVTKLPDRMGIKEYKQMLSWFNKGRKEKPLGFTSKGKVEYGALVKIFNLTSSQKSIDAVSAQNRKTYTAQITTGEDALNYMKLLSKRGWNKSIDFMPTPETDTKSAIKAARQRLLMPQGKVVIPAALRAILINQNLDINSIMEEGIKQTKETIVPNYVRLVLTGQEEFDYADAGIDLEVMDELRAKFQGTRRGSKQQMEMPKFMRQIERLGGREKAALESIKDYYVNRQNMFGQSEVDKLNRIKSRMGDLGIGKVIEELKEIYGQDIPSSFANSLADVLDDADENDIELFTKIGDFYKLDLKGMDKDKSNLLIRDFRNLRSASESVQSSSQETAWQTIEENYDEQYDLSSVAGLTSTDIFHMLVVLDWYYGGTDLHDKVQDWKNPDEYEEDDIMFDEVVASAKENYTEIVNKFVEAVKLKVEEIIRNPIKYQDNLVYTESRRDEQGNKTGETNTKASLMFRDLEEAGVVGVTT